MLIIPVFNEEGNIGQVLEDIKNMYPKLDILVVNDGSTDNTENIVKNQNTDILTHPYNLGYGGALQTGYKYAVLKQYNYVIQFDGDGQHKPEYISDIYNELKKNSYDIVIGSRFLEKNRFKAGILKKIAIHIFRFLIFVFSKTRITDPTSGLQGLTRKVFKYYSLMGNYPVDYPDADIIIYMLKRKYKIVEIPVNIRTRKAGHSMHIGIRPVVYFFKILLSVVIVLLRSSMIKEGCGIIE